MPHTRRKIIYQDSYGQQTKHPLYCLVFILPMLVAFQIASGYYKFALLGEMELKRILEFFGASAPYLPPLLIMGVLLGHHVVRDDRWEIRPRFLLGMLAESVVYVAPLLLLGYMINRLLPAAAVGPATQPDVQDKMFNLLLGVGAAIYEEFIFRLAFIQLVLLILVKVFELKRTWVAIGAVVASAVLFSLFHLTQHSAESFNWNSFVFRTLAGIYLGAVYLARGFGITVGTHTIYNILVIQFFAR